LAGEVNKIPVGLGKSGRGHEEKQHKKHEEGRKREMMKRKTRMGARNLKKPGMNCDRSLSGKRRDTIQKIIG